MEAETSENKQQAQFNRENIKTQLSNTEKISICIALIAALASAIQSYFTWRDRDSAFRAIIFTEQIDAFAGFQASLNFSIDDLSNVIDDFSSLISLFEQLNNIGVNKLRPSKSEIEAHVAKAKSANEDLISVFDRVSDRQLSMYENKERIRLLFPSSVTQEYEKLKSLRTTWISLMHPLLDASDTYDALMSGNEKPLENFADQIKAARRSLDEMNEALRDLERISDAARSRMRDYLATNRFAQKYTPD